jgi:predicted dinucleotide-binding enzyme
MTSALEKLKQAAKLREEADNKAKAIESSILGELKADLIKAEDAVKELKAEIKRLTPPTPKVPKVKAVYVPSEKDKVLIEKIVPFIGSKEFVQGDIQKKFKIAPNKMVDIREWLVNDSKIIVTKKGVSRLWKKA